MIRIFVIVLGLISIAMPARPQVLRWPERAAMTSLKKKRWPKAESQLRKVLQKDSTNAVAPYVMALYFFDGTNPAFHIDSAHRYLRRSAALFDQASPRQREKWQRFPLDSLVLSTFQTRLDSAAFAAANHIHTEAAFNRFLRDYPQALQRTEAIHLRDEVAYVAALKENTHEAFLNFLNRYPSAAQVPEARRNYDRLLFEARTNNGKLADFIRFLRDHPETPFRREAEQEIFERSTLRGNASDLLSFLKDFPQSHLRRKARNMLFHILLEQENPPWPEGFLDDSLRHVLELQRGYVVPFLKNRKFGFMNSEGKDIIAPRFESLSDDDRCGDITRDVLVLPDRLVARTGTVIFSGAVEQADDLGAGILKVRSNGCIQVIHKTGDVLEPCASDARVLGNAFVAIRRSGQWFLHALSGRMLLDSGADDLQLVEKTLAFRTGNTWRTLNVDEFARLAENEALSYSQDYDELKSTVDDCILIRSASREGVVNGQGQEIIPLEEQEIGETFFGFTVHSASGYTLYNKEGHPTSFFDSVITHEPWVAVKKDGQWGLWAPEAQTWKSTRYDTIQFEGLFPLGINGDTVSVLFPKGSAVSWIQPEAITSVQGADSAAFLMLTADDKKTLYDVGGRKLFTIACDALQHAGKDLFIIARKEKKGLVDDEGKIIVPIEYDAIGSQTNGIISLLSKGKFGLYDLQTQQLVKAQYDKNPTAYNARWLVVNRDGLYGFFERENKPHAGSAARKKESSLEWQEVKTWNDTLALVRKNQLWALYDIGEKRIVQPNIRQVKMVSDTPSEKVAIVQQESAFGVWSSQRGVIIPATFTDLVNVGSSSEPLYFTEKHVSEASVFVVLYYNADGRMLRKEIYEDTDDYERIYCPDN